MPSKENPEFVDDLRNKVPFFDQLYQISKKFSFFQTDDVRKKMQKKGKRREKGGKIRKKG